MNRTYMNYLDMKLLREELKERRKELLDFLYGPAKFILRHQEIQLLKEELQRINRLLNDL